MSRTSSSGGPPSRSCPTSSSRAEAERLGLTATDMDLSLVAHEPARGRPARRHHRRRAHPVRHRPQAAGRQRGRASSSSGDGGEVTRPRRPLACSTCRRLPADEFPAIGEERAGAQLLASAAGDLREADRQDPVRDLDRGDALLPERHPRPRDQGRRRRAMLRGVATDGHRLARVEVALPDGRRADPGDHRAAQDRGRGAQADRRASAARSRSACRRPGSSSPSTRGRWSRADRRHVPRL